MKYDQDIRANVLYFAIRVGPIIAWFYLFYADSNWLMIPLYAILSFIWYRGIMLWLHRLGLDLPILGIELLVDGDSGFALVSHFTCPYIVTSCTKMDSPDDLEQFRKYVLNHFMTFRRCKSVLVRIRNH